MRAATLCRSVLLEALDKRGIEPRLWTWERRLKLLLMVTLAYAFLLSWLAAALEELRSWLLRAWCHRTGKRSREASAPLYRIRSALSRLWQADLPPPLTTRLNSG